MSFRTKPYTEHYLTHPAFLENGDAKWMKNMANALVGLGNRNVITVNWGDLSTARWYGFNLHLFGYKCVLKKNIPKAGISVFYIYLHSEVRGVHSEPYQTSMMNLSDENCERLLAFIR